MLPWSHPVFSSLIWLTTYILAKFLHIINQPSVLTCLFHPGKQPSNWLLIFLRELHDLESLHLEAFIKHGNVGIRTCITFSKHKFTYEKDYWCVSFMFVLQINQFNVSQWFFYSKTTCTINHEVVRLPWK